MALHNTRGMEGELLAVNYLSSRGYNILHRNWRFSHYETDLIADKNGVLHFIEVKTRHSCKYGHPEEAVTRKKFDNLKKCAAFFLRLNPGFKRIQFDILAITRYEMKKSEFFLIEDVYI